ncbi:MAG: hypothetical protein LBS35_12290, partial [Synergistaceae bacterium]|nr:hypothetical protein [Synergistaceae bacterium]
MAITNLRGKYPDLISHMEEVGYSKDYISRVRREIEYVLQLTDSGAASSYIGVCSEYERIGITGDRLARRQKLLALIAQFDLEGRLPNGSRRQQLFKKGAYHKLCCEYKAVIDFYYYAESERGR